MTNEELAASIATGAPDKNEETGKHFLLIHGAWGGAREFDETIQGLERRGHQATAIDLPGHGDFKALISQVTMEAYVKRVVEAANAIEGRIILVGHSLGGSIISQVAEKMPEKIERLVYAAAILPKNGETALGLMQSDPDGQLLPRLVFSEDDSFVTVSPKVVQEVLLHDVKEPERLAQFLPHFGVKQATEPFTFVADLSNEVFGSVPKTYLRASIDKVLSPTLQKQMISSWDVDQVLTLESGHFPLMSIPENLVDALDQASKFDE